MNGGNVASAEPLLGAHLRELRARNLRPSTIAQRGYAVRRLARHLGDVGLDAATEDDLAAFLARPIAAESHATELSHLRQFYGWAVDRGLVERSPAAHLRRPQLPRRLPRPMTEGDLAVAVELAPERIRPWIVLAGWAGLRCAEIASLRAESLLWEERVIVVPVSKGGGMSSVPMSSFVVDELVAARLPGRGWLFPRRDGRAGPMGAHRVSQLGNAFLRDVGISATMHQLRHRFGTMTYRASGGDLRKTQEALRHRSSRSTELYTYVAPGEIADVVERLPTPAREPRLFELD